MFFDKKDVAMLYPVFSHPWSTDPVFDVNLQSPDLQEHPLLSLTQQIECILKPGWCYIAISLSYQSSLSNAFLPKFSISADIIMNWLFPEHYFYICHENSFLFIWK